MYTQMNKKKSENNSLDKYMNKKMNRYVNK